MAHPPAFLWDKRPTTLAGVIGGDLARTPNAFYNATGVRARSAPITPASVVGLLSQGKAGG